MLQQPTTQLVKRDPADASDLQQSQPSGPPPSLQAYHLATVSPRGERVQVSLNNSTTWRKFSRQNTEMIVTKAGRRMFPSLSLDIKGLDPAKKYEVYVTLLLADQRTLKYQRGVWIPNGPGEAYPPPGCTNGLVYVHPDSPATGKQWSKQEVTFMKLKLTNKLDGFDDPSRNGSMIFAYSMHKYLPVVHISEVPAAAPVKAEAGLGQERFYTSVVFPGTEFITVTAYQNPELTDLKIQFNPYAKGIRNQTADRSSTVMIESFRPTVHALQQRQQHHQQQPQVSPPSQHQQLPPGFEFGAYPAQSAPAYGHWHQSQHPSVSATSASSRRHHPYSIPSSSQQHQPQSATGRLSESPLSPTSLPALPVLSVSSAASSSAASAYYPITSGQQYQQYYQPPVPSHHLYYAQQYYSSQQQFEMQQQHQQQQDTQVLGSFCLSLTPPPQSQQHQHQQLHQHQGISTLGQLPHPTDTPQSCSALASSSHVTESSPSGISFSGHDL